MRTVYIADDGKEFDNEFECEHYEWLQNHPHLKDIKCYDKDGKQLEDIMSDDTYYFAKKIIVPTDECVKELIKFSGVGPKVADCIALFGMQKYDTFPVDVWVKRVMEEFYVEDNLSLPKIRKFALEKWGDLSGFAQQYLFYYARELGIGR